jgi:phage shock protein PspC (stress-responsive transcriptional regulator)
MNFHRGGLGERQGEIPMVSGARAEHARGMEKIRTSLARQGLVRSTDRAIIGGVCAGVGRRLGLTPWVTRLLFVVTLFVIPGSQILVYPLLWFLMPSEDSIEAAVARREFPTR